MYLPSTIVSTSILLSQDMFDNTISKYTSHECYIFFLGKRQHNGQARPSLAAIVEKE